MTKKMCPSFILFAVVLFHPFVGNGDESKENPPLTLSSEIEISSSNLSPTETLEAYFKNFENLSKSEKWEEIISQGALALEAAKQENRPQDEARICAQLTSSAFYLGDYKKALLYANRCHALAEEFVDSSLFIRSLYLESAIHRALAPKVEDEQKQQASYLRAIEICEEALSLYSRKNVKNMNLKGKIYFNLGAAYADNPKGDLEKAKNYYSIAVECFKITNANDDVIRTGIRLGKIHLLQKNYGLSQQVLNEVRPLISTERLSMHADYLEAQLKFAMNDMEKAVQAAHHGLEKAKTLGAKEDEQRLNTLLQAIEERLTASSSPE